MVGPELYMGGLCESRIEMKYPWKNKKEKEEIALAIAIAIADIYGVKRAYAAQYKQRRRIRKELMRFEDEEFYQLYKGYQLLNKTVREYCEEKDIPIYVFKEYL